MTIELALRILGLKRLSPIKRKYGHGQAQASTVHLWGEGAPYTRCAMKIPANTKDYQLLDRILVDCTSCLKVEARYGWGTQ